MSRAARWFAGLVVVACGACDHPDPVGELKIEVAGKTIDVPAEGQPRPKVMLPDLTGVLGVNGDGSVLGQMTLTNVGLGPVTVEGLTITASPADSVQLSTSTIANAGPKARFVLAPTEQATFYFLAPHLTAAADATVAIAVPSRSFDVHVDLPVKADLYAQPAALDFGTPEVSSAAVEKAVSIVNSRLVSASVGTPTLVGDPRFAIVEADLAEFASPVVIPPSGTHVLHVRFTPDASSAPAIGTVSVASVGPGEQKTVSIGLVAHPVRHCLELAPTTLHFGNVAAGGNGSKRVTVKVCGNAPVSIDGLALASADPDAGFDVALGPLNPFPTPNVTLDPGAETYFEVVYRAPAVLPSEPARATVTVTSDAPDATVSIAGASSCPHAAIAGIAAAEVEPQTIVSLSAAGSTPTGHIATYAWSVEQPPGSQSRFLPSADVVAPTFEADVVGRYTFHLAVTDDHGTASCADAVASVDVVPASGLHVELVWHTPSDADETDTGDGKGSDLDLHVVRLAPPEPFTSTADSDHDGAPDGWFDSTWDCFWDNEKPVWPESGKASLDRDDMDGGGPENLNLAPQGKTVTYGIGVHYWRSHGFGPSSPTLRVFVDGALVAETDLPPALGEKDLWSVGEVAMPTGAVTLFRDCAGVLTRCAADDAACLEACEWRVIPKYVAPPPYGF